VTLAVTHNWYHSPGTGRYLQPEPLLHAAGFITAMAMQGFATPMYAYVVHNPNAFKDVDGRKVSFARIKNSAYRRWAEGVSARLASCDLITDYFKACFGTNPWTNNSNYEFTVGDTVGGASANTNYWTNTTTLGKGVFSSVSPYLGGTIAHELSHQVSLETWDGFEYFTSKRRQGVCSADALNRLASCVLQNGCSAEKCSYASCQKEL
jgi:hypothetical protein